MNETYFKVNMFSYIRLIEIVLPKMVQQNRGIVINVSSQTALAPVPLMTTYAATKAFITFLSEGLSVEYESKGVTIQTVMPSMTKTKLLHGSHRSSFFAVTPEDFVSSAINTVGIETLTFGHWKHKLLVYIIEWFTYVCGNRFTANLALKVLKQSRDEYYMRINSKIE
ncbi:unnamed protein product [Oppiella nova]|uniref:Uncharacterized protein n=1 Tax=Oppiella nova TaxID=334625 RepID=A0A7R9MJH5_9ACAR|nr:unnamed protein product [Oppiella nova]CAG2178446.1 unnamed protein product [Oppiella nova]